MKLEGEHVFNGPRVEVWDMVRDPDVLCCALPGTQSLKKISENEYEGEINVRIGPVSGAFSGKLLVSNEVPPESCTLTVEGRGAPGFVKGSGDVKLTENEEGKTVLQYTGDLQIGGTLASVGQRMLDSVSKSMIRQGFEAFEKVLAERLAAKSEGREVKYDEAKATEGQYAKAAAKGLLASIMASKEGRLVLYIIPVVIIVYLLAKLLDTFL